MYRPFDFRWLYYDIGLTSRPAEKVMRHFLAGDNLGFITTRQTKEDFGVLAVDTIAGHKSCAAYDINTVFPLYLYPNGEGGGTRRIWFHTKTDAAQISPPSLCNDVSETVGLKFIPDGRGDLKRTFGPEDVFHYIYAIFHSQGYRDRYADFIKVDFPRVPVVEDDDVFRDICKYGAKLVVLHTFKNDADNRVSFDVPGSNIVEQVNFITRHKERRTKGIRLGRVYINAAQYFGRISPAVWKMRVGGYQVCQRWLKDRQGRALTHDEIEHYQRTVAALAETRRLMAQIDSLIADDGGWPLEEPSEFTGEPEARLRQLDERKKDEATD